jgi:hypothetical protein
MPRKATKSFPASASRSSSKRPAPETSARQSKRARATARKSYAEPETDTDEAGDDVKINSLPSENEDDAAASDYEDHSEKDPSSESERDEAASDEDTESKQATSEGRPVKSLPIHKKHADEKDLWKPGVKLAPGTRVVIKKPKARDAGDTPYTDHTIHPNTMLFLKDLAVNNDRQWLKRKWLFVVYLRSHRRWSCVATPRSEGVLNCRLTIAVHDPDFRVAFQDFTTFTEKVSETVIEADETIPELPVKDVVSLGV